MTEPRHKPGDLVRIWKPGGAEHGLQGVVDQIKTIEEYGGPAYRGPHAYRPKFGWREGDGRQWFGGFLPDAMICSEESYQAERAKRPHCMWRE